MDNFVDIILPGDENVTEATIMEWLKSPGDQVAEHEPLLEVSTDKVTIEIPSPASGILREVLSEADSVVYPGAILGRIESAVVVTTVAMEPAEADEDFNEDAIVVADQGPRLSPLVRRMLREHGLSASDVRGSGRNGRITHRDILAHLDGHDNIIDDAVSDDSSGDHLIVDDEPNGDDNLSAPLEDSRNDDGLGIPAILEEDGDTSEFVLGEISEDELPLGDGGVDWNESGSELTEDQVDETSIGSDVADQEEGNLYGFLEANESESDLNQTAEFDSDMELADISDCGPPSDADLLDGLGYEDSGSAILGDNASAETIYDDGVGDEPLFDDGASADPSFSGSEAQPFVFESEVSNKKPHTPMRRSIARHMVESVQTAPHVTAVFDADMSRVITHRELYRSEAERRGIRLTYTSYLVVAAARAIAEVPEINSVFHDDGLEIINHANIGVATALEDDGLIVPVLHRADELDLLGIARRLQDMVSSARDGALSMADVSGGTFTITNHGVSGSLIATPIINQPQSAILGVGRLEKRVVVRQLEGRDSIQIVPMVYVTLTIDHRALDGYQANRFLSKFVDVLETWELSHI